MTVLKVGGGGSYKSGLSECMNDVLEVLLVFLMNIAGLILKREPGNEVKFICVGQFLYGAWNC